MRGESMEGRRSGMEGSLLLIEIEVSFSVIGGTLLQPFQSTLLSISSTNKIAELQAQKMKNKRKL